MYCDGSGGKSSQGLDGSSWGINMHMSDFQDDECSWVLSVPHACLAGRVINDANHTHCIGSEYDSNNSAELSASTWCLLRILSHVNQKDNHDRFTIHYDSKLAAGGIF